MVHAPRAGVGCGALLLFGLALLLISAPQALAQGGTPAGTQEPGCPARPAAGIGDTSNIVVALHPDNLWRPRGGEVRFIVSGGTGGTIAVKSVQVCMGWAFADHPAAAVVHDLLPSPVVRSIAASGSEAQFGAIVPFLARVPNPWPFQLLSGADVPFTAAMTVPIADMVVAVTLADGRNTLVLLPVGVTSTIYAIVLVIICIVAFFLVAWIFVRRRPILGRSVLLKLICTADGYASLSQFQILLWTVTIGASAVYVMVLSGNLINLTEGTLALLGIAGGAALLARIPGGQLQAAAADPPPAANPDPPRWSDLVVVNNRTVDVTRVQMLIFTLISAAFVALQVLASGTIPEIPTNFLLLMGISNGIYVVGRQIPNQNK
jgi:hypothetical protein